jgi:hypothetical protein
MCYSLSVCSLLSNVPAVGAAHAGKGAFGYSEGVWRQLACGAIAAAALVGLQDCRVVEARNVLPRVQRDQNGARVRIDLWYSFSKVIILFMFYYLYLSNYLIPATQTDRSLL